MRSSSRKPVTTKSRKISKTVSRWICVNSQNGDIDDASKFFKSKEDAKRYSEYLEVVVRTKLTYEYTPTKSSKK